MARHYSKTVTITMTTAEKENLREAGKAEDISMSEFVRRAIQAYLDSKN